MFAVIMRVLSTFENCVKLQGVAALRIPEIISVTEILVAIFITYFTHSKRNTTQGLL